MSNSIKCQQLYNGTMNTKVASCLGSSLLQDLCSPICLHIDITPRQQSSLMSDFMQKQCQEARLQQSAAKMAV